MKQRGRHHRPPFLGHPLFAQIIGSVPPSMLMNILSQPFPKRQKIARFKFFVKVRDILSCLGIKLSGVDIAKAICWEITEQSARPMHILKTAVGVGIDFNTKVLLKPLIPLSGGISRLNIPFHQRSLNFKTK
jgi:hypothetical protein